MKESAFLLWILAAVLSENGFYSKSSCWIRWATAAGNAELAAVALRRACAGNGDAGDVAWSLSVVDVAIILGPGNPPRWQ